ncbi:MAG TPA: DUF4407 domain-containing protein [Ferruginibacter sp.]|nr:DUF4407 domain-containing protein [Ferruginibacter sp.]HMP20358.1 DUF4407 domain-containing protein [Ferruginibacter sp.]
MNRTGNTHAPAPVQRPSAFTRLLWWLSTAEESLLKDAVVDGNRHRIIGMTVLATWAFATLAWLYFFTTVTPSLPLAVFMGLFMGAIILTIDRALIKGISRNSKNKWLSLLLRGALAAAIGIFMAQPALLFMFRKEIALQVSHDNEGRKMQKRQELDSLYASQRATLLLQKKQLQQEAALLNSAVDGARQNYIAEADGSGGTGRVGLKAIALAKKAEYERLYNDYTVLQQRQQPQLMMIDKALDTIEAAVHKEEQAFVLLLNDGFLTQAEALNNLLQKSNALKMRYWLLTIILLLIELMPVLSKLMLPSGTYEQRVQLREAMEKQLAIDAFQKEQQLLEMYNQQLFTNDSETIRNFFSSTQELRKEKQQHFNTQWQQGQQSFSSLWQQVKNSLLGRMAG